MPQQHTSSRRRDSRRVLPSRAFGATLTPSLHPWPVFSTSPRHPGKLIQRRPDGTEIIGSFQGGTFVPD